MDKAKRILFVLILMSLFLTIPTLRNYDSNVTDWLIKILSKDIRLLFLPLVGIALYPKEGIFWICFLLLCLNIPTTMCDMWLIDKYDDMFVLIKTVLIIMLLYLIGKKLFVNK